MEREELNFYLQQAEPERLQILCAAIDGEAAVEVIQKPTYQTLMMPIHDPVNNGTFFGGEVLVTSAVVRVNQVNGWAMVMDENPDRAHQVALLDAAFAAGIRREDIRAAADEGRQRISRRSRAENGRTSGTRVSFDLL